VNAHAPRVRIVGRGRAGRSFQGALRAAGWWVGTIAHDAPELAGAARGVDLVLLCVPDSAIAEVAAAVEVDDAVVAHCSGASTLAVLEPHPRRASLHPLVALPDPVLGARRLVGAWFAVAGDPLARRVAEQLDGTVVEVADAERVRYHAAAAMASNHLVALLGQVQRVAEQAGVPLQAYLDLARGALQDVAEVGPARALTGPVARGDDATVRAHLRALDPAERPAYRVVADAAAGLAGRRIDWDGPDAQDRDAPPRASGAATGSP
jgi:predicted short-subunit dehydrogenase-like oxidoreductase (DUF2520 family)